MFVECVCVGEGGGGGLWVCVKTILGHDLENLRHDYFPSKKG